jgi:hypothetical protein
MTLGQKHKQATMVLGAWLLAAFACTAPVGCKGVAELIGQAKRESAAPARSIEPVSLEWEQNYRLKLKGTKGEATFIVTKDGNKPPLKLEGSFIDFPVGTKVKLGSDDPGKSPAGEEGSIGQGGSWSTLIDIKPAILKQSLDDLKGPVDLDLDLRIQVPGAEPVALRLPKQDVKDGVRFALSKARDGGVSFGAGDDPLGKPRGMGVVAGYQDLEFIGTAKKLTEIDWVAIVLNQNEPRTVKSCQFKTGPVTLKVFDATALIVDRRTSKKISERVLRGSDACPMFTLVNTADNTSMNTVAAKDATAWARAELAKAK